MLMYVDDIVIVGDRIGDVQKILDCLDMYCEKWGLSVNMEKTKLIFFRNGGIVKRYESVYYNGTKIDCVSYYKYLGVTFSTRLSWTPAQVNLAGQARKSLGIVDRINFNMDCPFNSCCKVFDTCVVPILTYCSEVWGCEVHNVIENVHVKFCKIQMRVGNLANSTAARGDCGRHKIEIACVLKCIKYSKKIVQMSKSCLVKSCYSRRKSLAPLSPEHRGQGQGAGANVG